MIDIDDYRVMLMGKGRNQSQVRKHQSDAIINNTFTGDPNYKRTYILSKTGWKWEDAKYQFHTATSILRDSADYYLQFRPKVHYPIGTYVLIPDDTVDELKQSRVELDNPFLLSDDLIKKYLWIIVGRDSANAYVRYNILRVNWNFKWLYQGHLENIWAIVRSANSYTSGTWVDEYSRSQDNLTGAWIPDTHFTYGDQTDEFHLSDTRKIQYMQRFLLTNNMLEPKVYQVTKIVDLSPQGMIKTSIKQDDFNPHRDNLELMICDYFTDSGDIKQIPPENPEPDPEKTSTLQSMVLGANDELEESPTLITEWQLGKTYYVKATFSAPVDVPDWAVDLMSTDGVPLDDILYYDNLIKITPLENDCAMFRVAKASSMVGKTFRISVRDQENEYQSYIEVEVTR